MKTLCLCLCLAITLVISGCQSPETTLIKTSEDCVCLSCSPISVEGKCNCNDKCLCEPCKCCCICSKPTKQEECACYPKCKSCDNGKGKCECADKSLCTSKCPGKISQSGKEIQFKNLVQEPIGHNNKTRMGIIRDNDTFRRIFSEISLRDTLPKVDFSKYDIVYYATGKIYGKATVMLTYVYLEKHVLHLKWRVINENSEILSRPFCFAIIGKIPVLHITIDHQIHETE